MKKTTTRLATIGGIVVLGACAIALAQHDARNRPREPVQPQATAPEPAVPISVDGFDKQWETAGGLSEDSIVRANNAGLSGDGTEHLTGYSNPLRGDEPPVTPEPQSNSLVVPASGESPADPETGEQKSPYSPPAWLGGGISQPPPATPKVAAPSSAAAAGTPFPASPSSAPAPPAALAPPAGLAQLPTLPPGNLSSQQGPLPGVTPPQPSSTAGYPPQGTASLSAPAPPQPGPAAAGPSSGTGALPSTGLPPSGLPAPPSTAGVAGSLSDRQPGVPQATSNFPSVPMTGTQPPTGVVGDGGQSQRLQDNSPAIPAAGLSGITAPAAPPTQAAIRQPGVGVSGYGRGELNALPASTATEPNPTTGRRSAVSPLGAPGKTLASMASLVSNQPGNRYLDGSQNPIMLIQKRAPEEIQVGKRATFVITVRNAGNAAAHGVTVVDSVPRGARFADSTPAISPDANGFLTWELGEMAAGDERTIQVQIIPEVQGEVGSVASVHFAAQASVRTVATLPKLELLLTTQPEALIGDRQRITVTIKNAGTGVARGVRLEADIPQQLAHENGVSQLGVDLGDMRPNESRSIPLDVTAVEPGQATCLVRAIAGDGVQTEENALIDVRAPQLAATIRGPGLRYLERQATYQIQVQNVGTAAATNLDFVVHLPVGLKYNSSNNGGNYDPSTHTVDWGLQELPAGQPAPVELTVLPVQVGPQPIRFSVTGDLGVKAEANGQVTVEGLAELAFTIGQDDGTVEIGASSTYSVQVTNVGDKPDTDVQLAVQLPDGAQLVAVDAPVKYQAEGNKIIFAPIPAMRNKDQHTFRFQVQHNRAGTQVVRTQLTSANWPVAVVKEKGTLVYNDQN